MYLEEREINGHRLKVLDPVQAPTERLKAYQVQEYAARTWGFSKGDIQDFAATIIKTCQTEDFNDKEELVSQLDKKRMKVHDLASRLLDVLKSETQFIPYVKAVACIILLDDEPLKMEGTWMQKKYELIKEDMQIQDFFLGVILALYRDIKMSPTTSKISGLSIQRILRAELLMGLSMETG